MLWTIKRRAFAEAGRPRAATGLANCAHSLFGTVGLGLAKVELSSYSGTIRILKRH